jgi:ribose transport system substrate-binding protein
MKRFVASVAGLTVAVAALSACSSASPGTANTGASGAASSAPAGGGRIALISKAIGADYWMTVKAGAMAAGQELGVEVTFNGTDTESEGDKQLNLLQAAINDKPLGIGLAPQDSAQDGAPALLDQAKAAGIPVVAFDTPIQNWDGMTATVASDNTGLGAQAAEQLAKLVGNKGEVAIVASGETGTAALRRDGFKDWITKNAPDMKVVDVQNGESDPAKSHDKAQGILQGHPNLVGMFGTDDDSTIGIADEVASMNKDVKVAGIDTSPDVLTLLGQGKIAGVVAQNPYDMGYQAVKILYAASKGQMPASKNVVAQSIWVTKDNLNDPDVQKVLGKS